MWSCDVCVWSCDLCVWSCDIECDCIHVHTTHSQTLTLLALIAGSSIASNQRWGNRMSIHSDYYHNFLSSPLPLFPSPTQKRRRKAKWNTCRQSECLDKSITHHNCNSELTILRKCYFSCVNEQKLTTHVILFITGLIAFAACRSL